MGLGMTMPTLGNEPKYLSRGEGGGVGVGRARASLPPPPPPPVHAEVEPGAEERGRHAHADERVERGPPDRPADDLPRRVVEALGRHGAAVARGLAGHGRGPVLDAAAVGRVGGGVALRRGAAVVQRRGGGGGRGGRRRSGLFLARKRGHKRLGGRGARGEGARGRLGRLGRGHQLRQRGRGRALAVGRVVGLHVRGRDGDRGVAGEVGRDLGRGRRGRRARGRGARARHGQVGARLDDAGRCRQRVGRRILVDLLDAALGRGGAAGERELDRPRAAAERRGAGRARRGDGATHHGGGHLGVGGRHRGGGGVVV